jgi:hypothetical protein
MQAAVKPTSDPHAVVRDEIRGAWDQTQDHSTNTQCIPALDRYMVGVDHDVCFKSFRPYSLLGGDISWSILVALMCHMLPLAVPITLFVCCIKDYYVPMVTTRIMLTYDMQSHCGAIFMPNRHVWSQWDCYVALTSLSSVLHISSFCSCISPMLE